MSAQDPYGPPLPGDYNPDGTPKTTGTDWSKIAFGTPTSPGLAPAALGAVGKYIDTKQQQAPTYAQIAEKQKEFQTQQGNRTQELARRGQLMTAALPTMLGALGYSPANAQAFAQNYAKQFAPQQPAAPSAPGGAPGSSDITRYMSPGAMKEFQGADAGTPSGPGVGSKILGAGIPLATAALPLLAHGGAAAGAAGGLGTMGGVIGGLATNPITIAAAGALGAGLLAKSLIGRGRRAADELTHPGGMQNAFELTLKDIDAQKLPPQQAWQLKQQAWNELKQMGIQHAAQGGKNQLVISQMFDTIAPLFGETNPLKG